MIQTHKGNKKCAPAAVFSRKVKKKIEKTPLLAKKG
jgi:hypothetical protein